MDQDQTLRRDAWLASLPRSFTGAAVLLTDEDGRVLVVKPNYRPGWQFAGGIIDLGEDAAQCARRELLEETGLDREVGPLLVVAWIHPSQELPHPSVQFMFDAGSVPVGTVIELQAAELDEYRWVPPAEAYELLGAARAPRLRAALAAREDGVVRITSGTVSGF
jgi:8-oxo-dGTP pyrophosphatase MutT (NUDIX family)